MSQPKNGNKAKQKSQDAFKWWNEKSTIRAGDSFGIKIKKIFIRIGGIIFLIVFSPVLLIALIIMFLLAL